MDQTVAALSKNTPTPAGPTSSKSTLPNIDLVDAISQLFAEMELVYHNQYTKAFGSSDKLNYAKRLWYSHLKDYNADIILDAAKMATRQSPYLPTVHTMVECCDRLLTENGIPSARAAYHEACLAPAPKNQHEWSHPLVYFAGRDTGWQYLHETAEKYALATFKEHYLKWRNKAQQGDSLSIELPPPSAATKPSKKIHKDEKHQRMGQLLKDLGL